MAWKSTRKDVTVRLTPVFLSSLPGLGFSWLFGKSTEKTLPLSLTIVFQASRASYSWKTTGDDIIGKSNSGIP